MKEFKRKFKEDPEFALMVMVVVVPVGIAAITAASKLIESSAYAYRASKLK